MSAAARATRRDSAGSTGVRQFFTTGSLGSSAKANLRFYHQ